MATILNVVRKNIWDRTTSPSILLRLLDDGDKAHYPPIRHEAPERDRLLRLWMCACLTFRMKAHSVWKATMAISSSRELAQACAEEEGIGYDIIKTRADLMRCIFSNPFVNLNIWVNLDYKSNPGMGPIREREVTGKVMWPVADNDTNWITYEVLQNAKNAQEYQRFPCGKCKGSGYMVRKGEELTFPMTGPRVYPKTKERYTGAPILAAVDIPCNNPACDGKGYTINGLLDPFGMMVLAESLEEAGCTEMEILRHLRAPTHCPNCWVLRMIIGEYQP